MQVAVELWQLPRTLAWLWHEHIVHHRLHDVPQSINVEQRTLRIGPSAGRLERQFHAGVENEPIHVSRLAKRGIAARAGTVMSKSRAGMRRDIEPAEVRLRQEQLMVRVSAKRLVLAEVQLIIGRAKSKMAKRGFTLVKQRRRAEPLTQAGRTQLRQPLDSLVKVIHLRLGQEAEAVVVPVFRYLDVRRRLRVAAEVALEKIAVHERVALILQQQFRSEIGLDVHRVVQAQSMAIGARGELASGATAGTGLRIAVVQNVDRGVACPAWPRS